MTNQENITDSNLLELVAELGNLIDKYDQIEDNTASFAKEDPILNIKQALAEKLSYLTGKNIAECYIESEKILSEVKLEIEKPDRKSALCRSLKMLSSDVSGLNAGVIGGVISNLVSGGTMAMPIISVLPGIATAVASFYVLRIGIEVICSDD
jgi:hypothetical protein